MTDLKTEFPELGYGLGLRIDHYPHVFEQWPAIDWFEVISENFMDTDGRPKRNLARIREKYPVVLHGVSLSIGTIDSLNSEYLKKLKILMGWLQPAWVSDHLCWTGIAHKNTHDLLPMPYTQEALRHVVERIDAVQNFLGRRIALENPSTYLEFKASEIPEAEFIAAMAKRADCALLLDVNNVYVSCYNHRLNPKDYIDVLPLERVAQIHLSGHSNNGTHIVDTHDDYVVDGVWQLYDYVRAKAARPINTMIEWDDHIPAFDVLVAELDKAKTARAVDMLPDFSMSRPAYVPNIITGLSDAQVRMQEAILTGTADADEWIIAKKDFAPAAQLGVYIHAYRARLYDAVAGDYPVLKKYLGDDAFDTLLQKFVHETPSSHFNINRYAWQLPELFEKISQSENLPIMTATRDQRIPLPSGEVRRGEEEKILNVSAVSPPPTPPEGRGVSWSPVLNFSELENRFKYELCKLEAVISELGDAQETEVLQAAHLENVSADDFMHLLLRPRAALRLMEFSYAVNDYYNAVMADEMPEKPVQEKTYLAVFRHEDKVWRMALEADEHQLLTILFAKKPVGVALVEMTQRDGADDVALMTNVSNWFARWMRNGLLAAPEQQKRRVA